MKVAVCFVIVWGEHSLASQLWWYFSPFVDISGVQMLTVLTALHFLVRIFILFEACRSKRRACLPANVDLSEHKGASDRMYRECIFLASYDPSLRCCARSSLTRSEAATEGVGGQLYLNSIRTRQMNGSMAARLWGRAPRSHRHISTRRINYRHFTKTQIYPLLVYKIKPGKKCVHLVPPSFVSVPVVAIVQSGFVFITASTSLLSFVRG